MRNEVNDTVKKAKIDYEKSIALNAKKEPKRFWKYVKQKTKSKSSIGNLLKTDGTSTETDSEKADELNSFFASVFTHENLTNIPIVQDLNFDRPLETIDVSINQVEKLLQELNTTKSMGPDNMHPFQKFCYRNYQRHYVTLQQSYFKNQYQLEKSQKSGNMQR